MGVIGMVMELLEIRNIMMFNLILQSTLTLFSPLRKTTSSTAVQLIIWAAYTVAGLAADYAVGLATRATMGNTSSKADQSLIALWAPFIFLQVVGPDTITAFSMEDTKSWFRSSFRVFLTGAVLNRVILVLLPRNRLAIAVFSVLFAGLAKYIERCQSLFFGNLTRFKTFTKPFSVGGGRPIPRLPIAAEDMTSRLDAFQFFQTFKGVFANVFLTPEQCSISRDYFLKSKACDAFQLVETELNLAYDVLYTKTLVLMQDLGRASRLIAFVLELLAFVVWVSVDKQEFNKVNVRVTYTLVSSALVFDLLSVFRTLFSDWTIASVLQRSTDPEDRFTLLFKLIYKLISLKKMSPSRRWSKSVPRYSLFIWCTSKSSTKVEKMMKWLKVKDFIYNLRNMSAARFDDKLRDLLFDKLKYLAMNVEPLEARKNQSWGRGDWILRESYCDSPLVLTFIDSWFKKSMKFEKIVLLWHVATELCYYAYSSDGVDDQENELRKFNKVMSNYMAYLLLREQTLLSEVAGEAKLTFQGTCEQVVKVLIDQDVNIKGLKDKDEKVERACKMIVMENLDEEVDEAVDEYSVLGDARRLSKELKGMMEEGIDMWEVISKVWVELLCYAAFNCKASEHAAQLCKGGQLLTTVWLLAAHLGLSNQFQGLN